MSAILVVSHSRTGSTAQLREAVLDGVVQAGEAIGVVVEVVVRGALEATTDDVLAADAVVFATPARFGALAGLMKDFLERIYPWFEEEPDVAAGMAWTAVVKGATDPSGALRDLEKILTGLRWKQVLAPLLVVGDVTPAHLEAARELGATLAAGVESGLW